MHRIDGPGATVDNRFTEGDPVGAVPATEVTDDWLNDVQEELISILAAASITPVKGTQNQVLAAIQAISKLRFALTFSGNLTLLPADAGKIYIYAEPSDVTITLPDLASTPAGAVFEFINTGPNTLTISRAGSDQIDAGLSTVNTIVIPPNRSLTIVRANASLLWHAVTAPVAVQSVLGNLQAAETFSAALTATIADAGKAFVYSGTGGHTANLPAVASTAVGAVYEFINTGSGDLTVSRAGSDLIDIGASTVSSITLQVGQSLRLIRASGSSNWHAVTRTFDTVVGVGIGQTLTNVTGSRSSGVTYTNTTGRPIAVCVSVDQAATVRYLKVNGNNVARFTTISSGTISSVVSWIIQPGETYSVDGWSALWSWWELR